MPTVLSPEMKADILAAFVNETDIAELSRGDGADDEAILRRFIEAQGEDIANAKQYYAKAEQYQSQLESSLAKANAKLATGTTANLSRSSDPQMLEILRDRSDLMASRVDLLVERGDIPSAMAEKIKGAMKTTAGDPNVVMLSRDDGLQVRPIDFIINLFGSAGLGVKSGATTTLVGLSRDGTANVLPGVANTTAELKGGAAEKVQPEQLEEARRVLGTTAPAK